MLVVEDLIVRDVDKFLTNPIAIPLGVCSSYFDQGRQRSVLDGSSSFIPRTASALDSRNGLLIDRTSDVETTYSFEVASPIFQG